MSIEKVVKCDGCGRVITRTADRYKLCLKIDRFWDGTEWEHNLLQLDFCYTCAREIKETLRKINSKLSKKEED